jgi:lipopolysaccharide/colanic/teichoic acid biosynthesis glycosyltransferase
MSSKTQFILKRLIDILLSFIGLVLLTVPFAIIALAIKLNSKGAVFFRQERVGKDGRSFKVWKFRTMVVGAVQQGLGYNVAKDDSRITRVGALLRNWGLDELPQLINVFIGEMSLVGPRPTLRYQVEQYNNFQRHRLLVKPGITSFAVVSGRNAISWKERIELDVWYVEHWSLWLDIKILFKTLWTVLVTREGLYGEDGVNDPFVAPPEEGAPRKE